MIKLTAETVEKIFIDSLFTDEETKAGQPKDFIEAEGMMTRVGFHPGRLESHRQEVKELLAQLPDTFHEATGGGWSFLNACVTSDGEQWGEHRNVDELFMLGIGLKLAKWQLPRTLWRNLPGGMPYVVILKTP